MKQPLFPSTIGTQSRFAYFLTVKAVVRKFGKSDGQTGSWCLDKAVPAQGGGHVRILPQMEGVCSVGNSVTFKHMVSLHKGNIQSAPPLHPE